MPTKTSPTVVFTGGDYRPQKLASGLVGLRAPFAVLIPPGQSVDVDLKTKCSVPLLFAKGVDAKVLEPGENIVVRLTNADKYQLQYVAGEVIARAFPLIPPSYEIA